MYRFLYIGGFKFFLDHFVGTRSQLEMLGYGWLSLQSE